MTHATQNGRLPSASCCSWTCAKLDVSVFRDPVTPTVSMKFWRYVCNIILLKTPSQVNRSSWVFREKQTALTQWKSISLYSHLTANQHIFSVCVCFFFLSFRKWLSRGPLHWRPSTPPAKPSPPSFHSPPRSASHQSLYLISDSNEYDELIRLSYLFIPFCMV